MRFETLKKRIKENEPALAEAKTQLALATSRQIDYSEAVSTLSDSELLSPLHAAITVQEQRINAVIEKKSHLVIKAPISGQVAHIFHHAGEVVALGTPLLTITDPNSNLVLAYVDERFALTLKVDDSVEVVSKNNPKNVAAGNIKKIGPRIEG